MSAAKSIAVLVLGATSLVYVVYGVMNAVRLPVAGSAVVVTNFVLAAVLGALWLAVRSGRLARSHEALLALTFVLALGNALHTFWRVGDPLSLVFMSLCFVAFAGFSGSDLWFGLGSAAMVISWTAVNLAMGPDLTAVLQRAYFLGSAVVLSIVIYAVRRRGLVRLGEVLEELREHREMVRSVVDGAHDVIVVVDRHGNLMLVNEAWRQRMGLGEREAVGTSIFRWVDPESIPQRRVLMARLAAGRNVEDVEVAFVAPSGERLVVHGRIDPVLGSDGRLELARGYFRDITSERRLEGRLARQETLLRQFAEVSHQVLWVYDTQARRFLFVNEAFEELAGRRVDEVLDDPSVFFRLFRPEDLEHVRSLIDDAHGGRSVTADHVLVRADGSERWVRLRAHPLLDEQGRVVRIAGVSEDISRSKKLELELERSERQLRAREELLSQFVRHTPAAVAMFDTEMRYLAASDRWRAEFGLDDRPLDGLGYEEATPEVVDSWREIGARCLSGHRLSHSQDQFVRRGGEVDWLRWDVQPWRDARGLVAGLLVFAEVVTESMRATEALRRKARIDSLTGALNRSALAEDLQRYWKRWAGGGDDFGVLYLDLDDFKAVNDWYGHAVGDDVLVECASRLQESLRPGDVVARLGGDELVVVAQEAASLERVRELGARLRRELEEPIRTRAGDVGVGVSVGVAIASRAGSAEDLLSRADRDMYRSKRQTAEGERDLRAAGGPTRAE